MADVHISVPTPEQDELDMMRERMYAYIFPNEPITNAQKEAFDKAVDLQIAHEKTIASQLGGSDMNLPNGVSGFTIGSFSMNFGGNGYENSYALSKKDICPYAYSALLRSGLLYKGVRGNCDLCL